MGTYANFLVGLLSVAASLDDGHDDVLGGHEGQLLGDAPRDDLRVDDQALGDVLQRREHDVRGQEGFRERDAAVRAVVERALEPLHAGRVQGVLLEDHQVACETADALGAHRVALVRHGGRADLRGLEGLLDFLCARADVSAREVDEDAGTDLEVGEEAQVGGELVCGRTEAGQGRENVDVDFARVRLGRHGVRIGEAGQSGDPAVELLDLGES